MEQLGSHRTDFHEILYLSIFRKSVQKIQVSLKSDKNNSGTLHEDQYTFFIISRSFLIRMRNVSDKRCTENQNTHFRFRNAFSRKRCRLWDNVEKYCRAEQATDDNTIRRMCIACWISKAIDTNSEYVIFIAFPLQQWLHERASVLRYTYIASLVTHIILRHRHFKGNDSTKGSIIFPFVTSADYVHILLHNIFCLSEGTVKHLGLLENNSWQFEDIGNWKNNILSVTNLINRFEKKTTEM